MRFTDVRSCVVEHVAAFNAHDTPRLLAGLSPDAVWTTGRDTFRGESGLAALFDPWLWTLQPSLELRTLLADGPRVAAQLREVLVMDGARQEFDLAGFFTVRDGLITHAQIYREGSADLDGPG